MTRPEQETSKLTPRELGYRFPAEFEPQLATWLSWPHKEASWPGKIDAIYPFYCRFIEELTKGQLVRINVADEAMKQFALSHLRRTNADLSKVEFYFIPTNDAWCRDHGPAFLVNPSGDRPKAVVDWGYNAWGDKYPPYDLDDVVPTRIAQHFNLPSFNPGIVMEGGSVEFNGRGTILTSKACLLNKNRNPHLNQQQIEHYLFDYYGASQVLWVDEGIIGDDTDGHIDDTVRFVNHETVLTVVEDDPSDENYMILQHNLQQLEAMRLPDGSPLKIIQLPMPEPVIWEEQRLPASYANFYIANHAVIVPTFRSERDEVALRIIGDAFPGRAVVGIDSTEIIWGLGSFHCLSQQEPIG